MSLLEKEQTIADSARKRVAAFLNLCDLSVLPLQDLLAAAYLLGIQDLINNAYMKKR